MPNSWNNSSHETFYFKMSYITHQTECIDAYRRHRCWSHGVQDLKARSDNNKFSSNRKDAKSRFTKSIQTKFLWIAFKRDLLTTKIRLNAFQIHFVWVSNGMCKLIAQTTDEREQAVADQKHITHGICANSSKR